MSFSCAVFNRKISQTHKKRIPTHKKISKIGSAIRKGGSLIIHCGYLKGASPLRSDYKRLFVGKSR